MLLKKQLIFRNGFKKQNTSNKISGNSANIKNLGPIYDARSIARIGQQKYTYHFRLQIIIVISVKK
jgi:hypothetical protein